MTSKRLGATGDKKISGLSARVMVLSFVFHCGKQRARLPRETDEHKAADRQFSSFQFSSLLDGIYMLRKARLRSITSLRRLSSIAFETVQCL